MNNLLSVVLAVQALQGGPGGVAAQGIIDVPPFYAIETGSCQEFPIDMFSDINPRMPGLTCSKYGVSGQVFKYDGVEWDAPDAWFDKFISTIEDQGAAIGMTPGCTDAWSLMFCNAYYPKCNAAGEPMRMCQDFCQDMGNSADFCQQPWKSLTSFGLGGHVRDCETDRIGDETLISMLYTTHLASWEGELIYPPTCDDVTGYLPSLPLLAGDVVTIRSSGLRAQVHVPADGGIDAILELVASTSYTNNTLTVTLSGRNVTAPSIDLVKYEGCNVPRCRFPNLHSYNPNDPEDNCKVMCYQ